MKASRLIQILAEHMSDPDGGGDFEVYAYQRSNDRHLDGQVRNMCIADCTKPVERCWLYPGIKMIIIGTE